jgi:hypothetical protein
VGHSFNSHLDGVEPEESLLPPLESETEFLGYVFGHIAGSEEKSAARRLEKLAQDVLELANHLGYSEVDLLGFSVSCHLRQHLRSTDTLYQMGGQIASKALVLSSSNPSLIKIPNVIMFCSAVIPKSTIRGVPYLRLLLRAKTTDMISENDRLHEALESIRGLWDEEWIRSNETLWRNWGRSVVDSRRPRSEISKGFWINMTPNQLIFISKTTFTLSFRCSKPRCRDFSPPAKRGEGPRHSGTKR